MFWRNTGFWLFAAHLFTCLAGAQTAVSPAHPKANPGAPGSAAQQSAEPAGVPSAPPPGAVSHQFHDKRYGVRFEVPAGWNLATRDNQLSTFDLDARTAGGRTEVRAVAAIDFNPYPLSTFSGALFYYSVERHLSEHECALEAYSFGTATRKPEDIGGMEFLHGHDEHGGLCVEARDEVYTAYRKGSCYRFDLTVNTFCSVSSGALEMTKRQYDEVEKKMDGILSSVMLDFRPPEAAPKEVPYRRVVPLMPDENDRGGKTAQTAL